jgi:hypothetical protein
MRFQAIDLPEVTQCRIALPDGGSTQWFNSEHEAMQSQWFEREGAVLVYRTYRPQALRKLPEGMEIIEASKWEVARMMMQACQEGKAFAVQKIGGTTYKIMKI